MANIVGLREGLKTRLAAIAGLRVSATVPDSISPPVAIVGPPDVDFDKTFARGVDRFRIPVRVLVGRASERTAQARLDAHLAGSGAASVKEAIEGDETLGGEAQTLRVVEARGYGVYTVAGVDYLGVEWVVEIYA